jgi:hypothetical protein
MNAGMQCLHANIMRDMPSDLYAIAQAQTPRATRVLKAVTPPIRDEYRNLTA